MKNFLLTSMLLFTTIVAKAQMSYQVSLLNTATGEPRANVTVNATATITNSQNETIYTSTQRATSNDFGVLQLIVGNADTFKGLDTGKLPLFIEVSVDGTKIGKTQIMTVPVAEVATTLKSSFTLEELIGKSWEFQRTSGNWITKIGYKFTSTGEVYFYDVLDQLSQSSDIRPSDIHSAQYEIEGNNIYIYGGDSSSDRLRMVKGTLYKGSTPLR